jgi:PIN domain nuclease of toxin-antitoxin system
LIPPVLEKIESIDNQLYLSVASLWAIAIKGGLGKLELNHDFDDLEKAWSQFQIELLSITFEDTRTYLDLPLHHRDPFDRMLVAQAVDRDYVLVRRDGALDAYGVRLLWG